MGHRQRLLLGGGFPFGFAVVLGVRGEAILVPLLVPGFEFADFKDGRTHEADFDFAV